MSRERGSAPIELVAGTAFILVPVALLVLSFAPWLVVRSSLRSLASGVVRQLVLADGATAGAAAAILAETEEIGLDPSGVGVGFCSGSVVPLASIPDPVCGDVEPGQPITVVIEAELPVVVGSRLGPVTVVVMQAAMVDRYGGRP